MEKRKKGFFITFEGADGCGKTTQSELIKKYLEDTGRKTLWTREPGGAELGKELRKILLHYDGYVAPECEAFLFLADRAQHVETVIKPAVDSGMIVLCDRYTDSTVAYQGYGKGIDITRINYLNDLATGKFYPDLTLVFDVDSEIAQKRVGADKDRMESEGSGFHQKVRYGYLRLAEEYPYRIKIINANNSIEQVFEDTKKAVENFLAV